MHAGRKKGLTGVNIANTHHHPVLHQKTLHRQPPSNGTLLHVSGGELFFQRLRAKTSKGIVFDYLRG